MDREALLDEIERAAKRCRGGSVSNPRYFGEMFAGCVSANSTDESIALVALLAAVEQIAEAQAQAQRDEAKRWAAAL
jgi:hypothetical protein